MPVHHEGPINEDAEIHNGHSLGSEETLLARAGSATAKQGNRDDSAKLARITGRVNHFLVDRRPSLFCDDCIAVRLELSSRRQANRVTLRLAKIPSFWRSVGACCGCGKHKEVIRNV